MVEEGEIVSVIIDRLSDKEMLAMSNCIVERQSDHTFFEKSIYDRHMGICEREKICETCCSCWSKCVGGIGNITLPLPYYFAANGKLITQIMQNVSQTCEKCGGKTYKLIEKKIKVEYSKVNWDVEFFDEDDCRVVPLLEIKEVLDKVEYKILPSSKKLAKNIKRTSVLLNSNLLVTPVSTRPYIKKGDQYFYNDISTIYNAIVKEAKKKIPNQKDIYERIEMLQTQKKNKPLPNSSKIPQSLQDKIQGKEGLINSNINGKRVDHSARANITGFSDGLLGEVGVPAIMAIKQTLPTPGYSSNKAVLQQWVNEHKPIRLRTKSGSAYRFTEKTKDRIINSIKQGDMLERRIRNGDTVLFNRQPSLRPESIMSKTVKIVNNCNTLRLTLPTTKAFNADFDGDECNLHVLQDQRAQIECHELMNPAELMISTQKGTPLIVPVQDAIIGLYLLTCKDIYIERSELFDICFFLDINLELLNKKVKDWNLVNNECITTKDLLFSGKLVFSLILDETLNFVCDSKAFQIKQGITTKESVPVSNSILCSGVKCLIHKYYFSLGKWATCTLEDNIQKISNYYLSRYGFTVGLQDCVIERTDLITVTKESINTVLGKLEMKLEKKNLHLDNNFLKIIKSGAKGSMTNIVQISQMVGQQSIDGTIVKKEMRTGKTLPCFTSDNNSVEATGFVYSSFFQGLNKNEAIFHQKAGRKGIYDSTRKISDIGYVAKKLAKFLENYCVHYDMTVRDNETKQIVQYLFGKDGMNPARLPAEFGKKVYLSIEDLVKIGVSNKEDLFFLLSEAQIGLKQKSIVIDELKRKIWTNTCELFEHLKDFRNEDRPIDHKIKILELLINKRLFEPGTAIGLNTSSNFSEVMSQLMLRSFHFTGDSDKDITGGVKRVNQLFNRTCSVTDSEIVCIGRIKDDIYDVLLLARKFAKEEYVKESFKVYMEDRCSFLVNRILGTVFKQVVQYAVLRFCNCDVTSNCSIFKNCCNADSTTVPQILYVMNLNKLEDSYFEFEDVVEIVKAVEFIEMVETKHDRYLLVSFKKNSDDLWSVVQNLLEYNKEIMALQITEGSVTDCRIEFDEGLDDFQIIFKGIKLEKVMEIPFLDETTIQSTDPFEMLNVFGIEAARATLYNEIAQVLSFDGADIDKRYIDLICDVMCVKGTICSISNVNGVLTRCLFEKEIKKLNSSSILGQVDPCNSVESAVFLGKICRMGTGFFDLFDKNSIDV